MAVVCKVRNSTLQAWVVSAQPVFVYSSFNFSHTKEIAAKCFQWKSTESFSSWKSGHPSLPWSQEVSEPHSYSGPPLSLW